MADMLSFLLKGILNPSSIIIRDGVNKIFVRFSKGGEISA